MLEPLYYVLLFLTLAVGAVQLLLGFFGRKPGQVEIMMSLAVIAGLAVQLLVSTILAISGERAVISTLEYFGYLLVAIIVQVAAGVLGACRENQVVNRDPRSCITDSCGDAGADAADLVRGQPVRLSGKE